MIETGQFKKILVTGAGGFIGRRMMRWLEKNSSAQLLGATRATCDLSSHESVGSTLASFSPDCIFHLAATGVSHARANDQSVINENMTMLKNIIEHSGENTALIITGSMSEYGGAGTFKETDSCNPETEYGKAKLAIAQYVDQLEGSTSRRICVARLFGVYGPGESANRLFPSLIRGLLANETVALSDGKQCRDFVHVDDVCEYLFRLASCETELPGLVNLGTGQAVKVRDVCLWVAEGLNKNDQLLDFGARERSPGDADLITADVGRLKSILGSVPPQRLEQNMNVRTLFGLLNGDGIEA